MSYSYTQSETWSRTHARKVAGKVAADLFQMQQAYGEPSTDRIENYLCELVVLLTHGVLASVTYGFKRSGKWIVALRYEADMTGYLTLDDRSGRIPRGIDISGGTWGSYLIKNPAWVRFSTAQQTSIERELPFARQDAEEPGEAGVRVFDKTYSSAGNGVRRCTIGVSGDRH